MIRRVDRRLKVVEAALASHGGAVEVLDVSSDGLVRLRFDGMCAGCVLKPLTMATVVAPAVLAVPGVTGVDAPGTRMSHAARLRALSVRVHQTTDPGLAAP